MSVVSAIDKNQAGVVTGVCNVRGVDILNMVGKKLGWKLPQGPTGQEGVG